MTNKEMRLNMIKLFALGIKYANATIEDDDWAYTDIFGKIFDTNDEPATIEEIFDRLSRYENISHIEERKKISRTAYKIRQTNEMIELIKGRIDDLKPIT